MSSFFRLSARMVLFLALMLLVEFVSFLLYRTWGVNRLFWYPASYGLVAFAGYATVKRLPLVWGAFAGALLAGVTSLCSWPVGSFVLDGVFRYPAEADPLLVGTGLLLAAIVGAIVGVAAGWVARDQRRQRSRRVAMSKLAYGAFDELPDPDDEVATPGTPTFGDRPERR